MNAFWRLLAPITNPPAANPPASGADASMDSPATNAFMRSGKVGDGGNSGNGRFTSDFGDDPADTYRTASAGSEIGSGSDFDSMPVGLSQDYDAGDIGSGGSVNDDGSDGSDDGNVNDGGGGSDSGNVDDGGDGSDSGNVDNAGDGSDDGSVDDGGDSSDDGSVDDGGDSSDDGSVDDGGDGSGDGSGDASANNASANSPHPLNMATTPFNGTGSDVDLQGFNRRPYSRNSEAMFGTAFDPNNATAIANGGMNIHMEGDAGAEITAAQNATAYGSYTTTTKSRNVHGANQTAFFYGDGRKFEVDLFEPGLHGGDVNTFTSGMWLDNVKVAETSITASDLGFKSFHDQPMTYKMDFQPGNIKISALNSKGEWQTIVDHSDPRINDQLARDTNFKQMFSAWGVAGEYHGEPVDFQVLKTGYSA